MNEKKKILKGNEILNKVKGKWNERKWYERKMKWKKTIWKEIEIKENNIEDIKRIVIRYFHRNEPKITILIELNLLITIPILSLQFSRSWDIYMLFTCLFA